MSLKSKSVAVKTLIVLCSILLFITVVLAVLLAMDLVHKHDTGQLCLTERCVEAAAAMAEAMDADADPCADLYQFACGNWIASNPMPPGASGWGIDDKVEKRNQIIIRKELEKLDDTKPSPSSSAAEHKAKHFYKSCMDANGTREVLGGEPLERMIRHLGGWNLLPKTMSWNIREEQWSLQKTMQKMQSLCNSLGFFLWYVTPDIKNSTRYSIAIEQGGLSLPTRDYYLKKTEYKEILEVYHRYMTKVVMLLGAEHRTDVEIRMQKVIDLETNIARISTDWEDKRDTENWYTPMSLRQLNSHTPFLNWTEYLGEAFKPLHRKLSEDKMVVVYAADYLKKINTLVEQYLMTDEGKMTVKDYLMWHSVNSLTWALSKAFKDSNKELMKTVMGTEGDSEKWKDCVGFTDSAFGFATGAMFVRKAFDGESKRQSEDMIESIKKAFKANVGTLDWMSQETKSAAALKVDFIENMIGYPDYIMEPIALDEKYEGLDIKTEDYFQNILNIRAFGTKRSLKRLDKPVNRTRWEMNPSEVNAYYSQTKNLIAIPAGHLQPPYFRVGFPRSVNFGSIGAVIGHEILHAFDDQGRKYDRFGNLNQWWDNSTIEQFNLRAKCIQEQYSKYSLEGRSLKAKQTLGEDIADNGGLKFAYKAYMDEARREKDETLPGLDFTPEQLFFISYAQSWCSSSRPESLRLQVQADSHTIAEYRVHGSIANMPEFADAFKCPLGSKMNPKHKCHIW